MGIQRENATLAVALANTFINRDAEATFVDYSRISEESLRGLRSASLKGRCQLLKEGPCEWYVDGAHTEASLTVAGQWYAETVKR